MSNAKVKVTLVRSVAGSNKRQRATVKGLGLSTKINNSAEIVDNKCVRGMINKVSYLLKVEG